MSLFENTRGNVTADAALLWFAVTAAGVISLSHVGTAFTDATVNETETGAAVTSPGAAASVGDLQQDNVSATSTTVPASVSETVAASLSGTVSETVAASLSGTVPVGDPSEATNSISGFLSNIPLGPLANPLATLRTIWDVGFGFAIRGPVLFAKGIWDAVWTLGEFTVKVVQNPTDYIDDFARAGLCLSPAGIAARDTCSQFFGEVGTVAKTIASSYKDKCFGSATGAGECVFEVAAEVALALTTGGAGNLATRAKELRHLGRATRALDNAGDVARTADKVTDASRAGRLGAGACFTAGTPVWIDGGFSNIESIDVGSRLVTLDDHSGADTGRFVTAVSPATHRLYQFELPDPTNPGMSIEIQTIRPVGFADQTTVGTHETVRLSFPEWGIDGDAYLTQVLSAPTVPSGDGYVILSTFKRQSADVFALRLTETGEILEATGNHRFWSNDRNAWVAARDLRRGETLRGADGPVSLASIDRKPGVHTVYNIEVETEHTYLVGQTRVLTHNDCVNRALGVLDDAKRAKLERQAEALFSRADHPSTPLPEAESAWRKLQDIERRLDSDRLGRGEAPRSARDIPEQLKQRTQPRQPNTDPQDTTPNSASPNAGSNSAAGTDLSGPFDSTTPRVANPNDFRSFRVTDQAVPDAFGRYFRRGDEVSVLRTDGRVTPGRISEVNPNGRRGTVRVDLGGGAHKIVDPSVAGRLNPRFTVGQSVFAKRTGGSSTIGTVTNIGPNGLVRVVFDGPQTAFRDYHPSFLAQVRGQSAR